MEAAIYSSCARSYAWLTENILKKGFFLLLKKVALSSKLPILHKESHKYWQKCRYSDKAESTAHSLYVDCC